MRSLHWRLGIHVSIVATPLLDAIIHTQGQARMQNVDTGCRWTLDSILHTRTYGTTVEFG